MRHSNGGSTLSDNGRATRTVERREPHAGEPTDGSVWDVKRLPYSNHVEHVQSACTAESFMRFSQMT